jgi:hypothetical protein
LISNRDLFLPFSKRKKGGRKKGRGRGGIVVDKSAAKDGWT